MKRLAPLALVAALALTGCVAVEPSAESTPAPTVKPVSEPAESSTPTAKPTPTKASESAYPTDKDGISIRPWADVQIDGYLMNNGANSFKGWDKGTAQHETLSWSSKDDSELTIVVAGDDWAKSDLTSYAKSFMEMYGCKSGEVSQITVKDEHGKVSASNSAC